MKYVKFVGGVILGYAVMVVLITLVQETWFNGVGWYESSMGELLVAGFFTFLSAVAGAAVGTWVAGGGTTVVRNVMSLLVVTETTFLLLDGTLDGPLWFDLLASGSLVVGIFIGAGLVLRMPSRRVAEA